MRKSNFVGAKSFRLNKAFFSLEQMLRDIYMIFMPHCSAKNAMKIWFGLQWDAPLKIFSDENRIKLILTNLIFNALKYTERGKVELKVFWEENQYKTGGRMRFKIRDTGRGMSEKEM